MAEGNTGFEATQEAWDEITTIVTREIEIDGVIAGSDTFFEYMCNYWEMLIDPATRTAFLENQEFRIPVQLEDQQTAASDAVTDLTAEIAARPPDPGQPLPNLRVWGGHSTGDWTISGDVVGTSTKAAAYSGKFGLDTGVIPLAADKMAFTNPDGEITLDDYETLIFRINTQVFPVGSDPRMRPQNDQGVNIGNKIDILDYRDVSAIGVWKRIAIPIADFGLAEDAERIQFNFFGAAGQHYFIDKMLLKRAAE